jgi:hypothetical protein
MTVMASANYGWAQTNLPRLGIIVTGTAHDPPGRGVRLNAIRRALASHGWIEGQNIEIEIRDARGDLKHFAELAADLVRARPDVIWADSAPAARVTYAATRTIPIMAFDFTTDPVAAGYAENYYRPGKNVTGVFLDAPQFAILQCFGTPIRAMHMFGRSRKPLLHSTSDCRSSGCASHKTLTPPHRALKHALKR